MSMASWLRIRSDFGFPEAAVRERQERMSSGDELDEALTKQLKAMLRGIGARIVHDR
jgi:hypothetical protein